MSEIQEHPNESTDLSLHTALCAQRYQSLADTLVRVDQRLESLDRGLEDLRDRVIEQRDHAQQQYLIWAGALVAFLISLVGFLAAKIWL